LDGSPSRHATSIPNVDMPSANSTRTITEGSNAFAVDLWHRVGIAPGNLAISPAGISAALAMAWGGARGKTADEIGKVLHIQTDAMTVGEEWGRLIHALENPSRPYTLRIANRLFGETTFVFEQPFLQWTKTVFGAALEPMDFKDAADASRTYINAWVGERTEHHIRTLLPAGSIDSYSRLVLVNAIYFHADWQTPFEKDATSQVPFFVSLPEKHDVSMMHTDGGFRAAEIDGAKVLEIKYKGGDTAMMIILPSKIDGLVDVEKKLTATTIDSWTKALEWKDKVIVSLPRFELDPPAPLLLRGDLSALGMPDAFDLDKADFTNIANPSDPKERLNISEVIHKAFVKVDEKGTVAAAATGVAMDAAADAEPDEPPPFIFRADHPFLFFIIDKPSGLILFMGRVSDPSST
jgi:serpin B